MSQSKVLRLGFWLFPKIETLWDQFWKISFDHEQAHTQSRSYQSATTSFWMGGNGSPVQGLSYAELVKNDEKAEILWVQRQQVKGQLRSELGLIPWWGRLLCYKVVLFCE